MMERDAFKPLEATERMTLSQVVAEQIKQYIIDYQLKAGDKLPSERALVDKLVVSRSVVREALSSLEMIGILKISHGEGAYVRNFNLNPLFDLLLFHWKREKKSRADLHDLRAMMTLVALEQFMLEPKEEQIAVLREIIEKMKHNIGDFRVWHTLDLDFHRKLILFAEQELFATIVETLLDLAAKSSAVLEPADQKELTALNEEMVIAIQSGDEVSAKSVTRNYFAITREHL